MVIRRCRSPAKKRHVGIFLSGAAAAAGAVIGKIVRPRVGPSLRRSGFKIVVGDYSKIICVCRRTLPVDVNANVLAENVQKARKGAGKGAGILDAFKGACISCKLFAAFMVFTFAKQRLFGERVDAVKFL